MTVNEPLGTWSELFMLLAAMTYLASFVAFAWDMASHSRTLQNARTEESELVDATTASSGAGGASGPTGRGVRTTQRSVPAGQVADAQMRYTGDRRPAARVAVAVMVLAFVLHFAAVVARSIAAAFLSNERRSMTAPPKFDRSVTSPYRRASTCSRKLSPIRDQTDRGTNAREAAEHFWPW